MAENGTNGLNHSDACSDPKIGFCSATNASYPSSLPLSSAAYILSHLSSSPLSSFPALIDSASGQTLSYTSFINSIHSLSSSLQSLLSPPQLALILAPSSIHIPILYFCLLSLGIVVSPINPTSTPSEISHQIQIKRRLPHQKLRILQPEHPKLI